MGVASPVAAAIHLQDVSAGGVGAQFAGVAQYRTALSTVTAVRLSRVLQLVLLVDLLLYSVPFQAVDACTTIRTAQLRHG